MVFDGEPSIRIPPSANVLWPWTRDGHET